MNGTGHMLFLLVVIFCVSLSSGEIPSDSTNNESIIKSDNEISDDLERFKFLYLTPLGLSRPMDEDLQPGDKREHKLGLIALPESMDLTIITESFKNEAKYTSPEKAMVVSYCSDGFARGVYTYCRDKKDNWKDVCSITIDLTKGKISGQTPRTLSKLKNLDLIGADIDIKSLNALISMCPSVEMLVMPYVGVRDAVDIEKYPSKLKKLVLYNATLNHRSIKSINDCKVLEEIVLYGCSLTENIGDSLIGDIQGNLRQIELSHCSFDLMRLFMRQREWNNVSALTILSPYDWVAFDLAMDKPHKLEAAHSKFSKFPNLKRLNLTVENQKMLDILSKWKVVEHGFLGSKHKVALTVMRRDP